MFDHSKARRRIAQLTALALVLFAAAAVVGAVVPHVRPRAPVADQAARAAIQPVRVLVALPRTLPSDRAVALPGSVQALRSTVVYARINGYLKERLVDIGDRVTQGQLLAVIAAPEIDQQIAQARAGGLQSAAALEQSRTRRELARVSLARIRALAPAGVVSQQELDDGKATFDAATADVRVAQATLAASDANVRMLSETKGFARVMAPFAGVVTARMAEVGTLVTAGNAVGQELFRIDQSDPARVMLAVPQGVSPAVREGLTAQVTVAQLPGRTFAGAVTRDARALDTGSRTLLTEVQVPNGDGALLPGMYVEVALQLERPRPELMLPAGALVVNAAGTQILVLGPDGRIHIRHIVIDLDTGAEIAVSEGISAGERVVLNPDTRLGEGTPATAVELSAGDAP
jgi:RND family efflux transporter MFP subunit